jgi:hypothetical protein
LQFSSAVGNGFRKRVCPLSITVVFGGLGVIGGWLFRMLVRSSRIGNDGRIGGRWKVRKLNTVSREPFNKLRNAYILTVEVVTKCCNEGSKAGGS